MARRKKGCCGCFAFGGCLAGLAIFAMVWGFLETSPTTTGTATYLKFEKPTKLVDALEVLHEKNIVRNVLAARVFATLTKKPTEIQPGTYQVKPGMALTDVFKAIKSPIKQMVRLPEGWWIARTAKRLEEKGVCSSEEYVQAAKEAVMQSSPSIPRDVRTLDGYLFPDTYNLPPLTSAKDVVAMQLKTFQKKVVPLISKSPNARRILNIASMVELEAATDADRPRIAGVIENRIKKGIPLEIDATVLYAIQEWKVLPQGVVRTIQSPYNTYLHKGLPPGPIGSPGLKSIRAAMNPESHTYLYYVARPNQTHYFSSTYPEHLKNINKARAEWKAANKK